MVLESAPAAASPHVLVDEIRDDLLQTNAVPDLCRILLLSSLAQDGHAIIAINAIASPFVSRSPVVLDVLDLWIISRWLIFCWLPLIKPLLRWLWWISCWPSLIQVFVKSYALQYDQLCSWCCHMPVMQVGWVAVGWQVFSFV